MSNKNQLTFRQLLPILTIVFVDSMGLTIVLPVVPFYALAFGAEPTMVGLLIMCYALAQFIFAPILGSLSDRFGRKPILVIAQIGTFSSLLLMGFAWALPILFIARVLDGITGANLSTVQSAVSDMTTKDDRAKGLGLVGAASGMGFVFGPMISGLALRLAGNNYAAPAFVAAAFALLSIILTTFVFRETLSPAKRSVTPKRRPVWQTLISGLRSPQLGPLYLLAFAAQFIFGMFTSVFALFTLNRIGFNSVNNAVFFGVFGLSLMVMQGIFVGRWVKRFGEYRVLMASFVLTMFGFGLAAFTPQQAVPWYSRDAMVSELSQQGAIADQLALLPSEAGAGIGAFLFILFGLLPGPLGFTLQLPTINTLITKRVSSAEVGQALGVSAAFVGAGTVVGPVLSGWLFDSLAPAAPMAINAILSFILLLVLLASRQRIVAPTRTITPM
ncbi:MAG: MFS transporter [Chloroflexota bacterium]